jgi:hypothetical protein
MRNGAKFSGEVILRGAKVGDNLEMDAASFSKTLNADGLDVRGYLFIGDHVTFAGDVRLVGATVGALDLSSATASWPPVMDLEGLHYGRVGGLMGVGSADLRTPEQWIDWLSWNRPFSSQPYTQLATVLTAAGRRDAADAILFAGRERERDETCWSRSDIGFWQWLWQDFPSWVWLSFLYGIGGYGIGIYTLRVFLWMVLLTILGAVVLCFSPYAQQRSWAWRLGASLHRLLPVVELSKEFEDFFGPTVHSGPRGRGAKPTPRWRRESRANSSLKPRNSLLAGKIQLERVHVGGQGIKASTRGEGGP